MNTVDSLKVWQTVLFLTSNYFCEIFIDKEHIVLHSIDKFGETIINMDKDSDYIVTEMEKIVDSLTPRKPNLRLVQPKPILVPQ